MLDEVFENSDSNNSWEADLSSAAFVFQHRTSLMKSRNVVRKTSLGEQIFHFAVLFQYRVVLCETVSIIRACKVVERCPCVNFPAAIMA